VTKSRSALAIATIARYTPDKKLSNRGMLLIQQLASQPEDNDFTWTARVEFGRELVEAGHVKQGLAALRAIPESAGKYHDLAEYFINFFNTQPATQGTPGGDGGR
jgi:hypothetical protein